jgi:hypothetical protein
VVLSWFVGCGWGSDCFEVWERHRSRCEEEYCGFAALNRGCRANLGGIAFKSLFLSWDEVKLNYLFGSSSSAATERKIVLADKIRTINDPFRNPGKRISAGYCRVSKQRHFIPGVFIEMQQSFVCDQFCVRLGENYKA